MATQHDDELSRRIADLESQLAFQEDTIETLNRLVTQQAGELQLLHHQMRLLGEKFQQISDPEGSSSNDPAQEVPPHY